MKTTEKKLREEFEERFVAFYPENSNVYAEVEELWKFIESAIKEAVEAERERAIEIIKNSQLVNPLTGEPDGFVHVDKVIEELSQQKDE